MQATIISFDPNGPDFSHYKSPPGSRHPSHKISFSDVLTRLFSRTGPDTSRSPALSRSASINTYRSGGSDDGSLSTGYDGGRNRRGTSAASSMMSQGDFVRPVAPMWEQGLGRRVQRFFHHRKPSERRRGYNVHGPVRETSKSDLHRSISADSWGEGNTHCGVSRLEGWGKEGRDQGFETRNVAKEIFRSLYPPRPSSGGDSQIPGHRKEQWDAEKDPDAITLNGGDDVGSLDPNDKHEHAQGGGQRADKIGEVNKGELEIGHQSLMTPNGSGKKPSWKRPQKEFLNWRRRRYFGEKALSREG